MIPIARPILGDEEVAAVKEVLASGMLAQGPKVKAFESAFAKDVGRKHGIAVANGTEALHIALAAHGIGGGNEVLIPPLTFFATASTVLQRGAKPVFVDVTRDSYNMDPARLSVGITRKTAAIMPVHLYGQTAEMDAILDAARSQSLPVIEDAAQAHGAEYHGKKAGNLGGTACFSFYATKNMTTGEGGMIVTDDDAIADKARLLRDHGQVARYQHAPVARDEIVRILNEEGIGCRPSYPMPLYKQKALQDLRIRGRCPVAEDLIPRLFELPVHPGVGQADIDRILEAIGRLARSR